MATEVGAGAGAVTGAGLFECLSDSGAGATGIDTTLGGGGSGSATASLASGAGWRSAVSAAKRSAAARVRTNPAAYTVSTAADPSVTRLFVTLSLELKVLFSLASGATVSFTRARRQTLAKRQSQSAFPSR